MLPVIYHPDYRVSLRSGRPHVLSKYHYVRLSLEAKGLLAPSRYFAPIEAKCTTLELAHTSEYVRRVSSLRLSNPEVRRIGLPQTARVVRRSKLTCGGTMLAGWIVLETGIACNVAGGSHHANADYGAGFCIFNDVAVAAAGLLAQGVPPPILVLDADVHQGDGTARIFERDPRVFTVSLHASKNFPARKAKSDLDVALPDGTDDKVYLEALKTALGTVFEAIRPSLVFYNAGVDVHEADKLGRLALTSVGLRQRERLVLDACRSRDLPVVGVLGGGYSDDPLELAARHVVLFEEASRLSI